MTMAIKLSKVLHDQSTHQPLKYESTRTTEKTGNTFVSGLNRTKRFQQEMNLY